MSEIDTQAQLDGDSENLSLLQKKKKLRIVPHEKKLQTVHTSAKNSLSHHTLVLHLSSTDYTDPFTRRPTTVCTKLYARGQLGRLQLPILRSRWTCRTRQSPNQLRLERFDQNSKICIIHRGYRKNMTYRSNHTGLHAIEIIRYWLLTYHTMASQDRHNWYKYKSIITHGSSTRYAGIHHCTCVQVYNVYADIIVICQNFEHIM